MLIWSIANEHIEVSNISGAERGASPTNQLFAYSCDALWMMIVHPLPNVIDGGAAENSYPMQPLEIH